MSYPKAPSYRPKHGAVAARTGALGFTPEEEKEVLLAARSEAAEDKKVDEMLEILRAQERLKMITAGGVVVGLLYTLTQFGNLVSEIRRRRREPT